MSLKLIQYMSAHACKMKYMVMRKSIVNKKKSQLDWIVSIHWILVKFQRTEQTAHSVQQARYWIHLPNIWIQLRLFIRTKFNFRKRSGLEKYPRITSIFHNKNKVETKLNAMLIIINMGKSSNFVDSKLQSIGGFSLPILMLTIFSSYG